MLSGFGVSHRKPKTGPNTGPEKRYAPAQDSFPAGCRPVLPENHPDPLAGSRQTGMAGSWTRLTYRPAHPCHESNPHPWNQRRQPGCVPSIFMEKRENPDSCEMRAGDAGRKCGQEKRKRPARYGSIASRYRPSSRTIAQCGSSAASARSAASGLESWQST